ncbi:glutaredoxin family protein [Thalassomonas actiniarum]|uniref:Glutaredoxin n=1 Tax=Thalassomonas actiniarum TaxID=485447 RepID=A0AAE9YT95_9GAMM|nr:glutaredoxin [Thalassomonas actiniarum]WDE00363.1 glutaredoxin [Thalassomonas actiniarum]
MFIIRWLLGRIILFFDFIFTPRGPKRAAAEQQEINQRIANMSLYQLPACPFCVKVRRAMKRNGLPVELRNINRNEDYKQELISEGGKRTVPCLRIVNKDDSVHWLYESKEIVTYLEKIAS